MPNKINQPDTVVFSKIEQEILSKLTCSKLLTLKKITSKGFAFNQNISEYNTFANEEDIDKEIIDTYISQGIINLSILRDLNFSFSELELLDSGFQADEVKILDILGFVLSKEAQEINLEVDNIRAQFNNSNDIKNKVI